MFVFVFYHLANYCPWRRPPCVSVQCCGGSGCLLPEEESVLHAAGESWKPVQHQPGEWSAQPDQDRRLRERTQPPHAAGPRIRTRHRPQQRGRGTNKHVITDKPVKLCVATACVTMTRKQNCNISSAVTENVGEEEFTYAAGWGVTDTHCFTHWWHAWSCDRLTSAKVKSAQCCKCYHSPSSPDKRKKSMLTAHHAHTKKRRWPVEHAALWWKFINFKWEKCSRQIRHRDATVS